MSRVSDTGEVVTTPDAHPVHEPHIQVLRGTPTAAELAALVAVLGSSGAAPTPPVPERTRWGLPADNLRYAMTNFQRLTMQQKLHMQRLQQ
ncbi:acyl-CoA carboxylase epsilon subunit [Mycobacterium sp. Lab-001]|uniref:acyl-CoA carboxylase epsilon subunit n=1 Tax=Mycobacterium sp. Lab-001 TaxID=3410136 RepID=UPI003D1772DE